MREQDLKLLAERCQILADQADDFTKKRLQDLARRYEGISKGSLDGPKVVALSTNVASQPARIQSLKIQILDRR
jgi:hypothetical protein